ncbi:MAG: metallophosphoesterase [Crocinitomicaceae bacterium]|nr:metallophosphoesterase [Crocinitomicaceae bacterium]
MRILLLFLLCTIQLNAQVVDRYNYVQRPTDSSVTIALRTVNNSTGTISWGLTPGNLNNSLSESASTSKHFFDISGLNANTLYYYQTSTDMGYTSGVDNFYTAKPDTTMPFSFLHYGDCGYNNGIQNTIASLMEADSADFGVVAGDVDQGVGDDYDDVFFGVYQNMLKKSCHYTAIGNHDTYADNAATYLDNFYLPSNNPQNSERYYSFGWGNAKFICLDSNLPYTVGTDQYDWLVSELQCNHYQWLFLFFHHPPWTNAWSLDYYIPFSPYFLYQGNEDMRTDLVPLFEEYNVDFVLNGHSHCYQRGKLNGVKYIISGGAGASVLDDNTNSNSPNIDTEIYVNQYVRFEMNGDTATYLSIDDNDNIIDSVTTIKVFTPPLIQAPVITYLAGVLWSTTGNNFTWFLDGVQIMGATSQNFVPTQLGTYTVEITTATGCTLTSYPFILDNSNLEKHEIVELEVFPNPSSGTITIKADSPLTGTTITVTNAIGQVVYSDMIDEGDSFPYLIDLNYAQKGMYILNARNNGMIVTKLFVIE